MPGDFHFAKMEDMGSIMHCTGKKELQLFTEFDVFNIRATPNLLVSIFCLK